MKLKSVLLALFVFLPLQSFAAGYAKMGFMYQSESRGLGGSTNDVTRTMIDFSAGKVWPNGFTLGFLYGTENNEYPGGAQNRTGLGPSVGWMKNKSQGFYIIGTYFVSLAMSGGYKGKGNQIDVGYRFMLDKLAIGPQLSFKSFEYNEINGTDIDPAYTENRTDPYFTVALDF